MRTCPACGEDTKAETSEPCTECGFSPFGPQEPPEPPAPAAPAPQEAAREPAPEFGFPDQPEAPAPAKTGPRVAPIWIVLIIIGIAWQAFNLFDSCGEIFEEKPGPTAEETESALEDDAALLGLTGASADCPDSAEDTDVGASFDCTVTASGQTVTVTVTNHEDNFEWSRQPFFRLQR